MAYLRRSGKELTLTAVVFVGGALGILFLPGATSPVVRGLFAGVLLASSVWLPVTFALLASYSTTMGSWGEGFTREVLSQKRRNWLVEEDLKLGSGNVDHVVVTHKGVLVIESKWRGGTPSRTEVAAWQGQCARNVRRVRALLQQRRHHGIPVTGVVVAWGAEAAVAKSAEGEVEVVPGHSFPAWADAHDSTQLVSLVKREDIWQSLRAFRLEQLTADARR